MSDDIENSVLSFVSELSDVSKDKIRMNHRFEELGFDSLALVELSLKLRKDCKIAVTDDELDTVETVGELIDLVKNKHTALP